MTLVRQPVTRRRGAELEDALLDAVWDELMTQGYAALTFESVAERAGTSRPVLYRRWASKPELVRAAVDRMLTRDHIPAPDTGSLRSDLIAILRHTNETRVGFTTLLTFHLGPYFQETGTSPEDLRRTIIESGPSPVDVIFERAVERGEVDATSLTPRRRSLVFDLYRSEALMTLRPVPEEVIESILDEVFLPLVLLP